MQLQKQQIRSVVVVNEDEGLVFPWDMYGWEQLGDGGDDIGEMRAPYIASSDIDIVSWVLWGGGRGREGRRESYIGRLGVRSFDDWRLVLMSVNRRGDEVMANQFERVR